MELKDVSTYGERNMSTFIGCLDFPNDAFDDTAIFETPELRLITPKLSKSLRNIGIRVICWWSMVNQTKSVLGVEDQPEENDGGSRRWVLGQLPGLGSLM